MIAKHDDFHPRDKGPLAAGLEIPPMQSRLTAILPNPISQAIVLAMGLGPGLAMAQSFCVDANGNPTGWAAVSTSVVCGANARAADRATAIGDNSQATGSESTAVGKDSQAVGDNTLAAGAGSLAAENNATAVGSYATALGVNSTAVGTGTFATGEDSTATGFNAAANGKASSAYGKGAVADGDASIAMGANSYANTKSALAIGDAARATATGAIALGQNAISANNNTVSIGTSASASANRAIAIGANTSATQENAVAVGISSSATASTSVAIGFGAYTGTNRALWANTNILRNNTPTATYGQVALGYFSTARGYHSVAIGSQAQAYSDGAIAIGYWAGSHSAAQLNPGLGADSIAIGYSTAAPGNNGIAIGRQAVTGFWGFASAPVSIPFSYFYAQEGTAVGNRAVAWDRATAMGTNAVAQGQNSLAMGGMAGVWDVAHSWPALAMVWIPPLPATCRTDWNGAARSRATLWPSATALRCSTPAMPLHWAMKPRLTAPPLQLPPATTASPSVARARWRQPRPTPLHWVLPVP